MHPCKEMIQMHLIHENRPREIPLKNLPSIYPSMQMHAKRNASKETIQRDDANASDN